MIVILEKCLGTYKKVGVMLAVKVGVQLKVTTTGNVLRENDKIKKFTNCRFSLKQIY